MTSCRAIAAFRRTVWAHYRRAGRHNLPWRKTADPYRILVSEVMLQQTQVSRVIPKYKEFVSAFPSVQKLARSDLAGVLKVWSGLGYNRRAKYLYESARTVVGTYHTDWREALAHSLPGVGPYTRAAVQTFVFNEPHVMLETNIRTVFIHHFFPKRSKVADKEIVPYMELAVKGQDPRMWYWALMDYGAHLKQGGVRNNAKSRHYTKQSRFKGSLREVRGAILRKLVQTGRPNLPSITRQAAARLSFPKSRIKAALASLKKDGLIE